MWEQLMNLFRMSGRSNPAMNMEGLLGRSMQPMNNSMSGAFNSMMPQQMQGMAPPTPGQQGMQMPFAPSFGEKMNTGFSSMMPQLGGIPGSEGGWQPPMPQGQSFAPPMIGHGDNQLAKFAKLGQQVSGIVSQFGKDQEDEQKKRRRQTIGLLNQSLPMGRSGVPYSAQPINLLKDVTVPMR